LPTLVVVNPETLEIVDPEARDHIQDGMSAVEAWKAK